MSLIKAPVITYKWLIAVTLDGVKIPLGAFYDLTRANLVVTALQAMNKFESIELLKY